MREIKFRGYDIELKKWHYGNYYFYTDTIYCVASDEDHNNNEHHCILFDGFCDWNMPRPHYKAFVDKESIGQYISLKDKNGKKIYEGDIVEYSLPMTNKSVREIVFDPKHGFVVKGSNITPMTRNDFVFEVIGNIYENPELANQ